MQLSTGVELLPGDTFDEPGLAHEYWYVTDLGLELVLTHGMCLEKLITWTNS